MKKTDINAIQDTCIALLHVEPVKTDLDFIVAHPFFDFNPFALQGKKGVIKTKDLFVKAERDEAIQEVARTIKSCNSPALLLNMFRTNFQMAWVKFCADSLSEKDYSELLGEAWTRQENPNDDVNVPVDEAIGMFREAEKRFLMNDDELKVYENLPNEFVAYRGIANGHNPNGLSYTLDKSVAEWFANRFGDKDGYVLQAKVKKEDVLCYFDRRNESEVVIDSTNIQKRKVV